MTATLVELSSVGVGGSDEGRKPVTSGAGGVGGDADGDAEVVTDVADACDVRGDDVLVVGTPGGGAGFGAAGGVAGGGVWAGVGGGVVGGVAGGTAGRGTFVITGPVRCAAGAGFWGTETT